MNDHHLDDLIIGDPEPGSGKSKTLLTIIALLIVVLIIGLILWALLFNSPADDNSISGNTTTQQTKPLAPDLIPLDNYNNEVPVSKPKTTTNPTPVQKQTTVTKPAVEKPAEKKAEPAPAKAQKQESTQKPTTKPAPAEIKTAETKPAETAIIKNKNKTIYYIQVGAFKRDPSPKFIKKLKDNGFTFITKTSKDIRRVRVGPYDSYQEAKAALPGIKTKLGVDGLIVKY